MNGDLYEQLRLAELALAQAEELEATAKEALTVAWARVYALFDLYDGPGTAARYVTPTVWSWRG